MEQERQKKGGNRFSFVLVTLIAIVMTIANVVLICVCIDKIEEIKDDHADTQVVAEEENSSDKDNKDNKDNDESETGNVEYETLPADANIDSVADAKELIKKYMENGKGTMEMLRQLFPEDIVVYESSKYVFKPVNASLTKNEIDNSRIKVDENGEFQYVDEKGKVISKKGIDVSKYQEDIDWEKVAQQGVEFAIIRLGYRGYGTGTIVMDETFEKNVEGATKAGIQVGVYFFSQAITKEEAEEEATYVVDNIKKYKIDGPVVFDTEDIPNEDARAEGLTVKELTEVTVAFCEKVKKLGYTPMIYANLRWFALNLDMKELEPYDKWFAYYDKELYFPYKITMWQYSESGSVDGIKGKVDMNIWFED